MSTGGHARREASRRRSGHLTREVSRVRRGIGAIRSGPFFHVTLDRAPGELPRCVELPKAYVTSFVSIAIVTKGDPELAASRAWADQVLGPVMARAVQRYRDHDPVELAWLVSTVPQDALLQYPEAARIALQELQMGDGEFVKLVRRREHRRHAERTLAWSSAASVMTGVGDVRPEMALFVCGDMSGHPLESKSKAIAVLASAEGGQPVDEHRSGVRAKKRSPTPDGIKRAIARIDRAAVTVDLPRVLCPVHGSEFGVCQVDRPSLDWRKMAIENLTAVRRGQVISFRMRTGLPIVGDARLGRLVRVALHGGELALHFHEADEDISAEHVVGDRCGAATVEPAQAVTEVPVPVEAACSVAGCRVLLVPPTLLGFPGVFPGEPAGENTGADTLDGETYPCECGSRIPGPWTLMDVYRCPTCHAAHRAQRDEDGTTTLILESRR
jgi:hypothetical protein